MKNYRIYFTDAVRHHYPDRFEVLIAHTERHYNVIAVDTRFAASSKNPIDKRLDFSAYFLALIQTLDEQGESFETIRKICLEVVTAYVSPKNGLQRFLKRLPARLIHTRLASFLVKAFHKRVSTNAHPDGFVANIITDKAATYGLGYGVDIVQCGICALFKKHRYEKYASILCEVDELTSGLAGLQLIRTGTIALGAPKCDFRFKKVTAK